MRAVPIFIALILLQTTWHVMAQAPPAAAVDTRETYKDERISFRIPKGSKVTVAEKWNWDSYTIHMPSRGNETLTLLIGGDAEALESSQLRVRAARKADIARIGVEEAQGEAKFVLKEVSRITETHMENNVILSYDFKHEMHLNGKVYPGWVCVGFGSVNGVSVICRLSGPGYDPDGDYMMSAAMLCEIKKR